MTSGGTWCTFVTREFDCAVTAVIAQRTSTSKSIKTRTSRVSPAPPIESVPAITSTAGRTLFASVPERDERHILVSPALQRPSGAPSAYAGSAAEYYALLARKPGLPVRHIVRVYS